MSKDRTARKKNREQDERLDAAEERLTLVEEQADELERTTSSHQGIIGTHSARIANLDAAGGYTSERVDALEARVAALEVPTPPPSPPTAKWKTIWTPQEARSWDGLLAATLNGQPLGGRDDDHEGNIADVVVGTLRFTAGREGSGGGSFHTEVQALSGPGGIRRGGIAAYQWAFNIAGRTKLPILSGGRATLIHQSHANEQTGFGGGLRLGPDGRLELHVRGGDITAPSGSQHREYEKDFVFDGLTIERDRWYVVRREVRWDAVDGFSRCWVDGTLYHEVEDVPTFPTEKATASMFRLGFYAQPGPSVLDMSVRDVQVQVPA